MTESVRQVVWFRRDLRVHDHPALAGALARGAVAPLFVLDPSLLRGRFASPNRVWFLLRAVDALAAALRERGATLHLGVGSPAEVVPAFAGDVGASDVWVSRDLAPYGRRRDLAVAEALGAAGVGFHARAGLVVHEPEVLDRAGGGTPAVFTPFLRRWEREAVRVVLLAPDRIPAVMTGSGAAAQAVDPLAGGVQAIPAVARLRLEPPTADPSRLPEPGEGAARTRLTHWLDSGLAAYDERRNELGDPSGTSRLGADLRFGLLSPAEVVQQVRMRGESRGALRFLSQLAWRDFYAHLLWHRPEAARAAARTRFAGARWPGGQLGDSAVAPGFDGPAEAWRQGKTGYPIVDAGMRQLAATGWMHNRARMVVASFLAKDLLIDWRVGEAHFMRHLLDGDPASNLGGWQWAASTGVDAQPWFRVFNPVTQGRRFDADGGYVRRWVPELAMVPSARVHAPWTMTAEEQAEARCRIGIDYPAPIVDHAAARERALAWFGSLRPDA